MKYGRCIHFFFIILILQHYSLALHGMIYNDYHEFLIEASREFDKVYNDTYRAELLELNDDELNLHALEINDLNMAFIKVEDPLFKSYITFVVESALEQDLVHIIPRGFLHCYEQITNNKNLFLIEDLQEITEVVLDILDINTKRVRPSANSIVGPLLCDTSTVINMLLSIESLLMQCCNKNTIDFNITFSSIADIKNTLTLCCENIINNFNSTFTTLAEFDTTLTTCCAVEFYDLSGTYSALNYGYNSTETIITADFNSTVTLLDAIMNVLNDIQITFSLNCYNFQSQISGCCTTLELQLGFLLANVGNAESIVQSFLGHECNDAAIAKKCLAPFTSCASVQTCG